MSSGLGALSTCPPSSLQSAAGHLRDVTRGNSWSLVSYLRLESGARQPFPVSVSRPVVSLARSLVLLVPLIASRSRLVYFLSLRAVGRSLAPSSAVRFSIARVASRFHSLTNLVRLFLFSLDISNWLVSVSVPSVPLYPLAPTASFLRSPSLSLKFARVHLSVCSLADSSRFGFHSFRLNRIPGHP